MVRDAHGAAREFQGNIATQWGVTHEDEAREDFERMTGKEVVNASFCIHPLHPWIGASPDGFVDVDDLLEIKCPFGIRDHQNPTFKTAAEQPHYVAQMQIQMFVTERSACHFFQWTPYATSHEVVEYNPSLIANIFPKLREFYEQFLIEVERPEDYLEDARIVIDTPRALQMVAEYDDLVTAIEQAEERKKELLQSMVDMAKGRDAVFGGRKLTKTERSGSISYASAIKVLAPGANLEPWRGKPVSFWGLK
jgi:putative phage-type endonuclease